MNDLLVKFPTRSRPKLFQETFRLYRQDESATFLITIDHDDPTMNNPSILAWLDEQPRLTYRLGNSKSKVEAVNDGLAETDWRLCILASDDMIPQRPDYAKRIAELYDEFFPDGDGVLHLNDGFTGRNLNTLPILDRRYFDRDGYVYAPCYRSIYVDNEFQEVSERRGRAVYVGEVVIQHNWVGFEVPDDLLRRNESYGEQDGRLFESRKRAGFPPVPTG